MALLQKEISFLEEQINNTEKIATQISSSNVAWHIDHSLKVILRVSNSLIASNPKDYKWKFNRWRFIVLTSGTIPRGKTKAPKQVRPPENINIADINSQLTTIKKLLVTVEKLPLKSNFNHHIFGKLDLKKTVRFLEVHTNHHIKIIKDILKNQL